MVNRIRSELLDMAEPVYKVFHSKLIPTVSPEKVIGIPVPVLRRYAKTCTKEMDTFLKDLPHLYYEENNLHAFLIEQISDFSTCIESVERFLPYIDNWATCDSFRPKCFYKNREKLLAHIKIWIKAEHPYTVRFAIEMLMCHFLEDLFSDQYLKMVSDVRSEEYYVKMMVAWYFATALAKHWDATIIYLEESLLPPWIHNKTIQKAIESYRITPEQKAYLSNLRV